MPKNLSNSAANIAALKARAKKRIPAFAFDYLAGGCNDNLALAKNRHSLDSVALEPRYLDGDGLTGTETSLLGHAWRYPFGIAPLGLGGIIWPGAAEAHARAAKELNIPYVLSTLATTSLEKAVQLADGNCWFQLYPPKDISIRNDLIKRAQDAGCRHLVVTVDVPVAGRRPKDIQNGLAIPPRIDLHSLWQSALRPRWSVETLIHGLPRFESIMPYVDKTASLAEVADYIRIQLKAVVDEKLLREIRRDWPHHLIVKGISTVRDAQIAVDAGADALIVSNHGGRQLDAAIPAIDQLSGIVDSIGDNAVVMADSGVESGVDIARFLARGAQMVFCGRAFMYGVGAFGAPGALHSGEILAAELEQVLAQLRCASPAQLKERLS